jgi:GH24 family phage-related lysozyme (muramidase)
MESLVKYCKAGGKILKGLQKRRLDEKQLFLYG